jgi:hypothetical protein
MVRIRRTVAPVAALLAALALASCASFQQSRDREAARRVTDLINAGSAEKLAAMSLTPFLVDAEIVLLPEDVAAFWNGIVKAGFRVDGAVLDRGTAVGADSSAEFADTMEVRTFFARYVKKDARILSIGTDAGGGILVIAAPDWLSWKIIGWKGPF